MCERNTPTLETQRLILRRFTQNDLPALQKIYSDPEVMAFVPMFPLQTREETRAFFERYYADTYRQPWGYKYAICLKSDDLPIGYVKVEGSDSYDLGYGLNKEFWHRGIVSEASAALVQRAKADGLPYITATHDRNNPRSGNVMKRIGMTYRYSYKELWQPKNILVTFRMYQMNFTLSQDWVYRKYWDQYPVRFVETGDMI